MLIDITKKIITIRPFYNRFISKIHYAAMEKVSQLLYINGYTFQGVLDSNPEFDTLVILNVSDDSQCSAIKLIIVSHFQSSFDIGLHLIEHEVLTSKIRIIKFSKDLRYTGFIPYETYRNQ